MDPIIKYPFNAASKVALTSGAIMAADISNTETELTISQMAAAGTLNLTPHAEMPQGARLQVRVSADGTNRVLTPGTGMTGAAVTITASKSMCLTYYFDGSTYVHTGTSTLN